MGQSTWKLAACGKETWLSHAETIHSVARKEKNGMSFLKTARIRQEKRPIISEGGTTPGGGRTEA